MGDIEIHEAARALAKKNFNAALAGLLAGHADAMRALEAKLAEKDMAFLMALTLTERGARLDPEGTMVRTIAAGIDSVHASAVERRFIARAAE